MTEKQMQYLRSLMEKEANLGMKMEKSLVLLPTGINLSRIETESKIYTGKKFQRPNDNESARVMREEIYNDTIAWINAGMPIDEVVSDQRASAYISAIKVRLENIFEFYALLTC